MDEKRKDMFKKLEYVTNDIVELNKLIEDFEHIEWYWNESYKRTVDDKEYNEIINITEKVLTQNYIKLESARMLLTQAQFVQTCILEYLKNTK